MKVAVIGSRNLVVQNLGKYLPEETMEIVSGGAKQIRTSCVCGNCKIIGLLALC